MMTAGRSNEGPTPSGLARTATLRDSRIHSPVVGSRTTSGATTPGKASAAVAPCALPGTPSQLRPMAVAEPAGCRRDGHVDRHGFHYVSDISSLNLAGGFGSRLFVRFHQFINQPSDHQAYRLKAFVKNAHRMPPNGNERRSIRWNGAYQREVQL